MTAPDFSVEAALGHDYVLIIEWLEPDEPTRTGTTLAGWINRHKGQNPREARLVQCANAREVVAAIVEATAHLRTRGIPVVHIEAHGGDRQYGSSGGLSDRDDGGELLAWDDLWPALSALNVATGFNLVVVVGACYGDLVMHGIEHCMSDVVAGHLERTTPLPFMAAVGFEGTIQVSALRDSLKEFYRTLFVDGALDRAVAAANRELGDGQRLDWIWMGTVVRETLAQLASEPSIGSLTRFLKTVLKREPTAGEVEKAWTEIHANMEHVHRQIMERMLGFDTHPGNRLRFPWVH